MMEDGGGEHGKTEPNIKHSTSSYWDSTSSYWDIALIVVIWDLVSAEPLRDSGEDYERLVMCMCGLRHQNVW